MTDSTTPKRIIPYALVSPLPVDSSSEDGRRPCKRKRLADMTSEEKAEKQLKRYINVCTGMRVRTLYEYIGKSKIGLLHRIPVTKENSTLLSWSFKFKDLKNRYIIVYTHVFYTNCTVTE